MVRFRMLSALNPLYFVIASLAGWLSEHQQRSIEYLVEENRILREQIGDRKLRFTDNQRRRLAVRAKELSRSALNRIATIVTPETLLAWHRKLIANKYDGSGMRKPGRPRTTPEVEALVVQMAKENRLIIPLPSTGDTTGSIKRTERLGGMLRYYYRNAA